MAAFQGRQKLSLVWNNGPNESHDSGEYKKELQATEHKHGKVARNEGDVDAAFAQGGKIVDADYCVPLLAHVSMEPMVALAEFNDGKVTAWAPTQNPQGVQDMTSKELGIPKEDAVCHVRFLGDGFGRRSKPDYVAEAAVLSKELGRPVKVEWTRADNVKFDHHNAVQPIRLRS